MNLAEIRRRLPMYVDEFSKCVFVDYRFTGKLNQEDSKVYFSSTYAMEIYRNKFLSYFNYTKLISLNAGYGRAIYELHGFKEDS